MSIVPRVGRAVALGKVNSRQPRARQGNNSSSTVLYRVGNTYQQLSEQTARLTRNGKHKKIHDWVLFVEIIHGDVDLIHDVRFELGSSFQPSAFTCSSPVTTTMPNGSRTYRFKTRQQTSGAMVATICINGSGGSIQKIRYPICIRAGGNVNDTDRFVEPRPKKALTLLDAPDRSFGIELELSCAQSVSHQTVANAIHSKSRVRGGVVIEMEYARVHQNIQAWKLVHDGSIVCSVNNPHCTKFELVSPILKGKAGLNEAANVIHALNQIDSISVNKSMGFHVHIGVKNCSISSLIKLCQNFVKYEDAIDTFMASSRRTGSRESNQYIKSNKNAVIGSNATNLKRHNALASCTTIEKLGNMINPTGRYYKLNIQNLVTKRQPTVEFRQHSATSNATKVNAWIQFCMLLTANSFKFPAPKSLKQSRTPDDQFEMLFDYVIKDRALKEYFIQRKSQVMTEGDGAACCTGCSHGHGCSAPGRRVYNL